MRWFPAAVFRKQTPTSPITSPSPPPSGPPVESAGGPLIGFNRTNEVMLREYTRSIYLWRCVDMIAQMSSSIVLDVMAKENRPLTDDERQIDDLVKHPNPQWTAAQLQYFIAASLGVANRAFLKRVRSAVDGATLELWPIPANEVQPRFYPNSQVIEAWERVTASGKEEYPIDETGDSDLICVRRPALNEATDRSPAVVALAPAEVFTRILQRCYDIVSNASNITGMLSTETEIGKTAVREIKDTLLKYRTGGGDSGGVLVTANAKWDLTRLSEDPSQALSVSIKDSLARDVCMTFGVPTQLVGIPGTDTYNNLALARVGLLTDTVLPGYINLYVSALNHALMQGELGAARIVPNVAAIPSMAASRLQLVDTASKATMLSVNEQRGLLGYPPYDDDEMADVPVLLEQMRRLRLQVELAGGGAAIPLDDEPT